MTTHGVRIEHLDVWRGGKQILAQVSLATPPASLTVILGPSGAGKSTLLRAISGLLPIRSGRIAIGDADITATPPEERNIGMVFQDFALYPTKNVRGNIEFPLRMRGMQRSQRAAIIARLAEQMGLQGKLDRMTDTLSGGERQRVALARALVRSPDAFLFDEPLSNVDAALQEDLRSLIVETCRRANVPAIYVTHNRSDAWRIATHLAILIGGTIVQAGEPANVYANPANRIVAQLVGDDAIFFLPIAAIEQSQLGDLSTPDGFIGFRSADASITNQELAHDHEQVVQPFVLEHLEYVGETPFGVGLAGTTRVRARLVSEPSQQMMLRIPRRKLYLFDDRGDLVRGIEPILRYHL